MSNPRILADGRWRGLHGIGRFATETLSRLKHTAILQEGPPPLSIKNLVWQPYILAKRKHRYSVFFNPGFNPILCSSMPFVLTIHDLIHLHQPSKWGFAKQLFYQTGIKQAARSAYKILTVSEYSKETILTWSGLPAEKVVVVGNGVSDIFSATGERYRPGFPYLLHVGNTKAHKNIERLIQAFTQAAIPPETKLIFTGDFTEDQQKLIQASAMPERFLSRPRLSEAQLASYYRGALGVLLPSLYEGFGLPAIEAMASGVPVLTSNVTALPEVVGEAALLVDPHDVDALQEGIGWLVEDQRLRSNLIQKGQARATAFRWEQVTNKVQAVLDELL